MQLTFLGTGTSTGVPQIGCSCPVCLSEDTRNKRMRSAVFLQSAEKKVVIDTPPEFRLQCLREGIGAADAVLYTHEHADHLFGIDDIRGFTMLTGAAMPVYAEKRVAEVIRTSFPYLFRPPVNDSQIPEICTRVIDGPFDIGDMHIIPFRVMHGKLPILSYRIGDFVYATDVKSVPEQSLRYFEGVDTLVLDGLRYKEHCSHFNIEEALAFAERCKPGRCYLTHLSHEVDHGALSNSLPENVFVAYDGLKLEVY
ncbi:MAG: MBL fold metallo-hydrolase [Abditibacteriota bacterium]|nr:MBL fold metallo-hydrolase [Abditibacteriota bacterium]